MALYRVYAPELGVRFKATTDADRCAYMFTERSDASGRQGFGLVRIDKSSGNESGRIWSKERRPSLATDVQSQRVFMKTGDKELTAFGFGPN